MDGLSVAASGIAVVGIAVQLADSIKKLCDFWCSFKDAPEDVRAIATDLKVLSSVLEEITHMTQQPTPPMKAALTSCIEITEQLSSHVESIEKGLASTRLSIRKWSAFKSAFSSERVKKSQELLNSMKLTLSLGQQAHYGVIASRSQRDQQPVDLERLARQISQLTFENFFTYSNLPRNSQDQVRVLTSEACQININITNPVRHSGFETVEGRAFQTIYDKLGNRPSDEAKPIESPLVDKESCSQQRDWIARSTEIKSIRLQNFFCKIHMQRKTTLLSSCYAENQYQNEQETSFIICPAWWLVKLGISYAPRGNITHSTIGGWKYKFNPFRSVPENAAIFKLCETNNLSGVRALLSSGEASVKDINAMGWTPLHFAAGAHSVEICKLLISEGADKHVRDFHEPEEEISYYHSRSPLVLAASPNLNRARVNITDCIDTLRIFSSNMDFSDMYSDGWKTLVSLTSHSSNLDVELNDIFRWVIHRSARDIKDSINEKLFVTLMNFTAMAGMEESHNSLLSISDIGIDARIGSCGYTCLLLHLSLFSRVISEFAGRALDITLRSGANTHLVGLDEGCSPQEETPTSLAMYSSFVFIQWRDALLRLSVDLETFVAEELQQSPLRDAGWNEDTLLSLFRGDIQPGFIPLEYDYPCGICGDDFGIFAELSWRRWLDSIKHASKFEEDCNDESRNDKQANNTIMDKVRYPASEVELSNSSVASDEEEETTVKTDDLDESDTDDEGSDVGSDGEVNIVCIQCYYKYGYSESDLEEV